MLITNYKYCTCTNCYSFAKRLNAATQGDDRLQRKTQGQVKHSFASWRQHCDVIRASWGSWARARTRCAAGPSTRATRPRCSRGSPDRAREAREGRSRRRTSLEDSTCSTPFWNTNSIKYTRLEHKRKHAWQSYEKYIYMYMCMYRYFKSSY